MNDRRTKDIGQLNPEFWDRFFSNAPFSIAVIEGTQLIVKFANRQQLDSWGLDLVRIKGKSLTGIIDIDKSADLVGFTRQVQETGVTFQGKSLPVKSAKENVTSWYDITIEPIQSGENITAVVIISIEVPGQVKATNEVKITDDLSITEMSDAKRQVRLYEAVTESTPDLYYLFDLNYHFRYANKALLNMWGQTWEYANGRCLAELGYEPWHAEMHEREIDTVKTTKKPIRGEVSFPHATLGRRVYDYIFTPVFNDAGEVEAVAGTTRDITDLKRAEAVLIESERRFRDMADHSPMFVFIIEPDEFATVSYWNKTWLEYTGQTLNEARGRAWNGLIHPDDVGEVMKAYEPAFTNQEGYLIPGVRVLHHDGTYRWHIFKGMPRYVNTAFAGFTGVGIDIHEQKLATDALKESESRFRTMADHAPMFIFLVRANLEISYVNREILKFVGFENDPEGIDENWRDFIFPADIPVIFKLIDSAVSQHEGFVVEARIREGATGFYHWHLFKGMPRYEGDIFKGYIGTAVNIQQQKELMTEMEVKIGARTAELADSNRQLERSNDDLQQFAHVASHDLKEPVRKIRIFTARLKEELGEIHSGKVEGFLSKINGAANRMFSMIEGILSFSSVEGSQLNPEAVDLDNIVQAIQTDLELLIDEKDATILFKDLPVISGSPTLIHQLFYNLINNSLKFSKENIPSVVEIAATGSDSKYHRIAVSDNGIGFQQSEKVRIFQTFARLNSKDKYEGTGLGLALCKKIVERHGGQIEASGSHGIGAVFTITLPK